MTDESFLSAIRQSLGEKGVVGEGPPDPDPVPLSADEEEDEEEEQARFGGGDLRLWNPVAASLLSLFMAVAEGMFGNDLELVVLELRRTLAAAEDETGRGLTRPAAEAAAEAMARAVFGEVGAEEPSLLSAY